MNNKKTRTRLIIISLSCLMAYFSWLLHNDKISFYGFEMILGLFYAPMYIILMVFGSVLEGLFGYSFSRGDYYSLYLKDEMWMFSVVLYYPFNVFIMNKVIKPIKRKFKDRKNS